MKTFFKELLEYTFTFNNKVIESLIVNDNPPQKSLQLINHTINAQEIWNSRIVNKSISIGVWDIRPLESLRAINLVNYNDSLRIVDNFNFEQKITYTNTKGNTFENTLRDMLFHIVNHSTYHRGQIATDFKLNGIDPLITDYILYKR